MIIATSSPIKWKIGAELIKWYQGTTFSHVLIIDGDFVYQASQGYVNCMYIHNFLEHNRIIHTYRIPDEIIDMEFVKSQLGKEYGFCQLAIIAVLSVIKSIFSFVKFKYKGNGDQKFICSEFVGKALKLDWVDDLTTPAQIDQYLKDKYGNS